MLNERCEMCGESFRLVFTAHCGREWDFQRRKFSWKAKKKARDIFAMNDDKEEGKSLENLLSWKNFFIFIYVREHWTEKERRNFNDGVRNTRNEGAFQRWERKIKENFLCAWFKIFFHCFNSILFFKRNFLWFPPSWRKGKKKLKRVAKTGIQNGSENVLIYFIKLYFPTFYNK